MTALLHWCQVLAAVVVGTCNAIVALLGGAMLLLLMALMYLAVAYVGGTVLFAVWQWASFWAHGAPS